MAILKPRSTGRGNHHNNSICITTTDISSGHRPLSGSNDDDHDVHDHHHTAASAPTPSSTAAPMTPTTPAPAPAPTAHRHPDDTPYLHGIRLLDTFLAPSASPSASSSRVPSVLTAEEATGLRHIRQLLLSAHIRENHIPSEIRPGAGGGGNRDGDGNDPDGTGDGVTQYLVQEFGGVRKKPSLKKVARSVLHSLKFIRNARNAALSSRGKGGQTAGEGGTADAGGDGTGFVPPEWRELGLARKRYAYERLTCEALSRWDYDVLELAVACGNKPLLFVGWAILGAPHAQRAMARSIGLDPDDDDDDDRPPHSQRRPRQPDVLCDFIAEFHIAPSALCNFLRAVEADHLPDNPYHNSTHAADALQTLFSLLRLGGSSYASSPLELFGILCAAACHDMGHPGRNNSFQVRTKSDLAVVYNDISVLENMHAARATRLLSLAGDTDADGDGDGDGNDDGSGGGDWDILARMQPTQKEAFRSLFRRAILNTDMTLHFAQVAQMKARVSAGIDHNKDDDDDNRHLEKFYQTMDGRSINMALLFLLHAADVSNPAKAGPLFVEWCDRSLQELFQQGDEERRRYLLPLSPMCDRDNTNKNDSQIGYIKFIVRPTFVLLSDMIPDVVTEILPILEKNLRYWEKRKREELGLPMDDEEEMGENTLEEVSQAEDAGHHYDEATISGDESLSMEEFISEKSKERNRSEERRKLKADANNNSNTNGNSNKNNKSGSKSYERKRSKDSSSKSYEKKKSTNGDGNSIADSHVNDKPKPSAERKSSKEHDSRKVERKKSKEGSANKPLERKKSKEGTTTSGNGSGGGTKGGRRGSHKAIKNDTIKSKEEMMAQILSKPTFERDGSVYFS